MFWLVLIYFGNSTLTPIMLLGYALAMEKDLEIINDWEAICRQCGSCCFEKLEGDDGTIFFTQTPCRYLDVITRQCKIYERRLTINPACIKLTPDMVRHLNWLHDDCGYRQAFGLRRRKDR